MRAIALCLVMLTVGPAWAQAPMHLERVVLVSRHGVRPPTKPNAELAQYADAPWPDWPVAPGELTPHGAAALERMGNGLRHAYAAVLSDPCAVFLWADGADSRTRSSGGALAKGLAPGCQAIAHHGPAGEDDPMFNAIDAGACPIDADKAADVIRARMDAILKANAPAYARGRETLQKILTPSYTRGACTAANGKEKMCRIAGGSDRVEIKKGEAELEGPLHTGSTLSENLLLEHSQGMTGKDFAWGRADEKALAEVLALHNLYSDITRRNPHQAAHRASHLVRTILDVLDGKPSDVPGAPAIPSSAKLVVFLGHDGNLANLSGLLDAPWTLPGQPDTTAPDTTLAFELWRGPKGQRQVAVKVWYQTLADLRDLTRFTPARPVPAVALALPGCSGGKCPFSAFQEQISARLKADCGARPAKRP